MSTPKADTATDLAKRVTERVDIARTQRQKTEAALAQLEDRTARRDARTDRRRRDLERKFPGMNP